MKTALPFATFRRTCIAGALLLGVSRPPAAHAQQAGAPAGVQRLSDFSYRVWASNPASQRGLLQVVDADGQRVLFEERSAAVSFGRLFDMSQLPDGHYAFVVQVGSQQFRYSLNLNTTARRSAELRADTVKARLAARL